MKLLLVEDEERVARALARGLGEEGHQVDVCATGRAALDQGQAIAYDVVLLDWSLPDLDGVSVLRAWREAGLHTPVLLLTARGSTGEKVTGLRAGADDYLVKPFAFDELLARLEALNRRNGAAEPAQLGAVRLDPRRRALVREGRAESLTAREYSLLAELASHRGEVLSRSRLVDSVWGTGFAGNHNVVDVYVGYLRTKLERIGGAGVEIQAVRGIGYRLVAPEVVRVTLAQRLWVLGALVPAVALLVAVAVAGRFLEEQLAGALDQALLSQAAIESVSLFDGPGGVPHLHIQDSPIGPQVRAFAPSGALHGPDGALRVRYPADAVPHGAPVTLRPGPLGAPPVLEVRRTPSGERLRVLTVAVRSPAGEPHALQMTASLAQADASVAAFRRVGLLVVAGLTAALMALQTVLARRLSRRVNRLTGHMVALREGDLEAAPPLDGGKDEIGGLSRVVAAATDRLRAARAGQERLIAEAAHELRTPLTLVRTTIDLALRRRRSPEELEQGLREARDEVDRLAKLAARLLELASARRGGWDRSPGDVAQVAREAAEAARADAEARGVLVAVVAPGPAPTTFDRDGLRQALDNLLANAVRHSPAGGTVTVEVTTVAAAAGAPLVRVTVRDEGPGIPPELREQVFEPFARGRRGAGGAGLGLAIVRDVLRGHGGRAYVADRGPGATVVLELPTAGATHQ